MKKMTTESEIGKLLDFKALARIRYPAVHRRIPSFLYRIVSLLVQGKKINDMYDVIRHLDKYAFAQGVLDYMGISVKVEGLGNLPKGGNPIIISNHPTGMLDGIVLLRILGSRYPRLKVLANDILMGIPNLKPFFLPVDKIQSSPRKYLREIRELLSGQNPLISFPAGLVARPMGGVITDVPWNYGFVRWARKYQRDIVPVHISGRNSDFFYRFSRIRKRLGIRTNLEMFILIRELFKKSGSEVVVKIAPVVPWQRLESKGSTSQWGARIRRYVYLHGACSSASRHNHRNHPRSKAKITENASF